MDIAQKLSELMASRQMSRGALARALGVHTSTVTNWLSGKAVKSETLPAICDVFGCSIDYLLGAETKKEPTATNGSELTEETIQLAKAINAAAPDVQKLVEAILADNTYRPKVVEKAVDVVCPITGRIETIYQTYYVHDGKRIPDMNNGCDNCHKCPECDSCRIRVMESVR
jgi:transcriptional regulator with XRE-family HTH domain